MQKVKKIVLTSLMAVAYSFASYIVGYTVCRRKHKPKKVLGSLFIDHTESEKQPSIYLSNVDPIIFSEKSEYIVLELNHIRK